MLYKFDNDKYELCKKYIMEVYDGNKKMLKCMMYPRVLQ